MTGTGTIDLNGTNAAIATLYTNGNGRYVGQGGTITNSLTGPANTRTLTSVNASAQVFGGSISGNLNFSRANSTAGNTLTLTAPNTYTGTTAIRSSTIILADAGTLSGTSAIDLNYGGLTIDQSGLNPIGQINPTRVPAATPLTLRGGTLQLTAGGSMDASATFNTVSASQGHNTINVPAPTAGSTAAINVGNLALNPDATINLTGGTGGFFSNIPGLSQSNLYITNLNGVAIPATITGKILGGNLIANNGEFVTYVQPTTTGANGLNFGVVTMNGTTGPLGTITQTQYDATAITAAGTATTNVRLGGSGTLVAGGTTYNSLAVRAAGATITFTNAADVLNLASGGLALTSNTAVVGSAVGNGVLTAGGTNTGVQRLYIHNTGATINSVIANSGVAGQTTRLVANNISGTLTLAGVNTYTGGTVVNGGGTLALAGVGTIPAGGITLKTLH